MTEAEQEEIKSIGLKERAEQFCKKFYAAVVVISLIGIIGLGQWLSMLIGSDIYKLDNFIGAVLFIVGVLLLGYVVAGHIIWNVLFDRTRYLSCPYCGKSVLLKDNWQCEFCDNYQGVKRFFHKKCIFCKRVLQTCYCEHCEKEMEL